MRSYLQYHTYQLDNSDGRCSRLGSYQTFVCGRVWPNLLILERSAFVNRNTAIAAVPCSRWLRWATGQTHLRVRFRAIRYEIQMFFGLKTHHPILKHSIQRNEFFFKKLKNVCSHLLQWTYLHPCHSPHPTSTWPLPHAKISPIPLGFFGVSPECPQWASGDIPNCTEWWSMGERPSRSGLPYGCLSVQIRMLYSALTNRSTWPAETSSGSSGTTSWTTRHTFDSTTLSLVMRTMVHEDLGATHSWTSRCRPIWHATS